jgi:DNA-binding beta-propeller fold protein YncE
MNPYTQSPVVRQLFVSEPFHNTIAVIDLVVVGTAPNQVFGVKPGPVRRISSLALNLPVDLAPAKIDSDDVNWASNTTLDAGSDFYVANRGDNTIVRMKQDGTVVAVRRVAVKLGPLNNASLNGIATSPDGSTIYVTFTRPGHSEYQGGVLELPAFPAETK